MGYIYVLMSWPVSTKPKQRESERGSKKKNIRKCENGKFVCIVYSMGGQTIHTLYINIPIYTYPTFYGWNQTNAEKESTFKQQYQRQQWQ